MIKKHIPNTITSCNLISGCIAIYFAFCGDQALAFLFIVLGAVFDFFDGMSARLLGVSSPIGKELDSLADVTTFGVAPSAMVFSLLYFHQALDKLGVWGEYLPFVAFVMAAFSALRLAKFNLDERQTTSFIGLPTPANALFWGSLLVSQTDFIESSPLIVPAILVMVCISSWLMVSEIPMFALKFKQWGWKGNELRYSFIIFSVLMIVWLGLLESFWVIIAWYFIISCIDDLVAKSKKA